MKRRDRMRSARKASVEQCTRATGGVISGQWLALQKQDGGASREAGRKRGPRDPGSNHDKIEFVHDKSDAMFSQHVPRGRWLCRCEVRIDPILPARIEGRRLRAAQSAAPARPLAQAPLTTATETRPADSRLRAGVRHVFLR